MNRKLAFIKRITIIGNDDKIWICPRWYSVILTIVFILTSSYPTTAQDISQFIIWLTDIPGSDSKDFSGMARVDGKFWCTDGFNTWIKGAWTQNGTQCGNGARLINEAELDGYLADPAVDSYGDSTDQATFRWVTRTTIPGSGWCDGFISPISYENFYENCTPPGGSGGGSECEGGDICENPLQQSESRVIVPDNIPSCCPVSPIVIDILGDGFAMTDAQNGVPFDFNGDGTSHLMSWTAGSSDDAWLVLDRNGNGTIDSGSELFGNITPQPTSPAKNGFLALAEYDKLLNGGNRDGQIDRNDLVFARLRLWQDTNHNGISEPGELHRMNDLGLREIDLDYSESRRRDEYGNWFRYRSTVRDSQNSQIGRWAWDVFLTVEP